MKVLLSLVILAAFTLGTYAQQEIPLYNGPVPNSKDPGPIKDVEFNKEVEQITFNVSAPTLTVFLPSKEKANGTAVIVCPGGGYHLLVIGREGRDIAREFNKLGVAAFVLKYRIPDERIMPDKSIGPLQDAQRAIQIVRQRATEWNIDPGKIGIMGFSAGGHLASTAGTHFTKALIDNPKGTSLRPDFMILVYPVISLEDSLCHAGSRENLIGKNPSESLIRYFSNDQQVNSSTPPAFLILSGDDSVVKPDNSLLFWNALRKNGIRSEMHIYEKGEHGFLKEPAFDEWFGRICFWMRSSGLITK